MVAVLLIVPTMQIAGHGCRRCVQSHGLFSIEELRRNRGARTMASDVPPNISGGHTCLTAKDRDQYLVARSLCILLLLCRLV
jgi:hypothetical protein